MEKSTKFKIQNLIEKYYYKYCYGLITRDTAIGLATWAVLKCMTRTQIDGQFLKHKYITAVVNCVESGFTNQVIV